VLHLQSKRANGYPDIMITSRRDTQAATRSFRQGYFEARVNWTGGQGAFPAFWLFATAHSFGIDCPPYTPELDILEETGTQPNVFVGTLHRNTSGPCGVPDTINGNNWHPTSIDQSNSWHTYSALWTATTVTWYLDDVPLMSIPVYDSTNQDMFMIFSSRGTGSWDGNYNSTTPSVLDVQVDWVRVWQKT
jgi:beta-glucanase (GH16 family)